MLKPGDEVLVIAKVTKALDVSQSIDLTVEIKGDEGQTYTLDITDGQIAYRDSVPLSS